jgi:hypothetical protein
MNRFIDFYHERTADIAKSRLIEERTGMINVNGMYDDTDGFRDNVSIVKKAIMGDVTNEIVSQDEQIQKIDLALEKIMNNGNDNSSNNSSSDDDAEDDDEDHDGNEWDD